MSKNTSSEGAKTPPDIKKAKGGVGKVAPVTAPSGEAKAPAENKKVNILQTKEAARAMLKSSDKTLSKVREIFKDDGAINMLVQDETNMLNRRKTLVKLIGYQNWVIIILISILIMGVPVFRPSYEYYLMNTQKELWRIISLDSPNITNEALLSWARTSVIEILTLGFGNFDEQLSNQSSRFTAEGWKNFVASIMRDNMIEVFSKQQLVLTTIPSNDPVITSQGLNLDKVYEWKVEIPVAMTYTTNNNVTTGERAIISLTIVRVPTKEHERGIAIKSWKLGRN